MTTKLDKKSKGQFYTTNAEYIMRDMPLDILSSATKIVEPFAGQGDLLKWAVSINPRSLPVSAYDIDPKIPEVIQQDTLAVAPDYAEAWVITNPPYLARNKTANKELYDKYDTNDLYKCFILSVSASRCCGGVVIIPSGFFLSPREMDVRCRDAFMRRFRIRQIKYFEETVFDDTATTVVAVAFESHADQTVDCVMQDVAWLHSPSGRKCTFRMSKENDWIVGGEIYRLGKRNSEVHIRRHVEGVELRPGEQQTYMTLHAIDSGSAKGRIRLEYVEGQVFAAKECSRAKATMRVIGKPLDADEQRRICSEFNRIVEEHRDNTWSLFLPQFRESKEYARKRIPFELAYRILVHII